jgi:hypothetical protein
VKPCPSPFLDFLRSLRRPAGAITLDRFERSAGGVGDNSSLIPRSRHNAWGRRGAGMI